jgi:hypothetical protein
VICRSFCIAVIALSVGACAYHVPRLPEAKKVPKHFYTAKDRQRALGEAKLFEPRDSRTMDIIAGPPDSSNRFKLPFNAEVFCRFTSDPKKSGQTPKYDCLIERVVDPATGSEQTLADYPDLKKGRDKVKVKFGANNGETYAEVAGTRLLWLLGFYADAMYPVRVVCADCPEDASAETGVPASRRFPHAVIERRTAGRRMYEYGAGKHQGWAWKELDKYATASVAHRDALKLVSAFIVHGDNKAPQQRLVCDDVTVDTTVQPYATTCGASRAYVQDLGASFGNGGLWTSNETAKMNLEAWRNTPVWRRVGEPSHSDGSSNVRCVANLPNALSAIVPSPTNQWRWTTGLRHPVISEEGRRLLAQRLALLSDSQIATIFLAARVDEAPPHRLPEGANSAAEVIQEWVDVFSEKRNAIEEGACQWNSISDSNT